MPRFRVTLEYEGTRYSGWQVQKNARTVQGELLHAARTIFKTTDLEFMGSGRTDAGVHAAQQVAHLDVRTVLAPEIIRLKFNDELPADINILGVEKSTPSFHARHDAIARSYCYQICRRRTALGKRFVWWIKDPLDAGRMKRAARLFEGMRNFQSFTADDPEDKSTTVLVESVECAEAGSLVLIRIIGSHFLWKMVRQIVGMLVEVGRGKYGEEKIGEFLSGPSDEPARFTAPPSGLFLERVYYKGDRRLEKLEPIINIR
ncbi:MAG TPA: tRNA pseudouridine(38-40) synthase TruA [Bacteroidota bacterium]|nr:tRNA pseudouridine(38-40) synthase TruA [Bacteroidota bacterium]